MQVEFVCAFYFTHANTPTHSLAALVTLPLVLGYCDGGDWACKYLPASQSLTCSLHRVALHVLLADKRPADASQPHRGSSGEIVRQVSRALEVFRFFVFVCFFLCVGSFSVPVFYSLSPVSFLCSVSSLAGADRVPLPQKKQMLTTGALAKCPHRQKRPMHAISKTCV